MQIEQRNEADEICGLLTDLPAEELAALPCFAITDVGFINVLAQAVVDPILEVLE